ncbi:iron-sulfur cluster repair di-iron protein [Paludisphaera sp.]|uniref:iron-sulfur cluster repair di-iron protein n=1 Tax=Paludisphaera sp. TaxID=2017432 RepID=UPI00301BD841
MAIDATRAVGELVAEKISRASVFDRFGLDYCCHGQVALDEACRRKGVAVGEVVAAIAADDAAPPAEDEPDYASMPLTELADRIVSTHHALLRRELPRLHELLSRVVNAHADRHPELREVATTYAAFREELDSHQSKEEQVLFPMIRELEAATSSPSFHCGSVENPVRVMMHEHDSAGAAIARMRELTGDFATPPDGCTTYQALMAGLAAVEHDLHRHVHKENNILFPRAVALEASLAGV